MSASVRVQSVAVPCLCQSQTFAVSPSLSSNLQANVSLSLSLWVRSAKVCSKPPSSPTAPDHFPPDVLSLVTLAIYQFDQIATLTFLSNAVIIDPVMIYRGPTIYLIIFSAA